MANPYEGLPDYQFWRRSISRIEAHCVDPMVSARFRIAPTDRVATAGSCFAQHIARKLAQVGGTYLVTEPGDHLSPDERRRRNYGVFSARTGNLYTIAQLRQLLDEAYGSRMPAERAFERADGRFFDPYRQQIEPDGFATIDDLVADRALHLKQVCQMVERADVFVFTLGLTEAWRSRVDGSIYSMAPGVVAGCYDPEAHEFVNFGIAEVERDLSAVLELLKRVNSDIKVVLTVSPVPLVATFEPRSVLVSTAVSKAVLRVVADMAVQSYAWVDYFPSYEIITGSFAGGLYYEGDYREVNSNGVAHAMRCFVDNFIGAKPTPEHIISFSTTSAKSYSDLVCDEDTLDMVRN